MSERVHVPPRHVLRILLLLVSLLAGFGAAAPRSSFGATSVLNELPLGGCPSPRRTGDPDTPETSRTPRSASFSALTPTVGPVASAEALPHWWSLLLRRWRPDRSLRPY